jgi:hypothetical protein
MLAAIPGVIYALRASATECTLWISISVGILLSAPIVLGADGWRTLAATHPFGACVVAMGFTSPGVVRVRFAPPMRPLWQAGAAVLALAATLFVSVPILSRALEHRGIQAHPPLQASKTDEHVVPGGRRLTGFLVLPDNASRPHTIPALLLSEFAELIRLTHLENEFGPFMNILAKQVPFAFVTSARLDKPNQLNLYIAPPAVLQDRSVWAWRLILRDWQPPLKESVPLKDVAAAIRLP